MYRKLVGLLALLGFALTAAGERSSRQYLTELLALIDQADEIVVYSEGMKREFVIYGSSDRKDFEELKAAIALKNKGGPFLCACIDGPEISLLKKKKEIAAIWNHDGTAIGSSVWKGDWETSDPNRWLAWFDARGMKNARYMFDLMREQSRKSEADEKRWLKAMPASVKPLWPKLLRQYNPPSNSNPDLKPLNAALEKQFPNADVRIRALMAWYGSGAGPWSGYPAYEEIVAKLLRQYPTSQLIRAVENRNLSELELEGAARILGGWQPVPDHTPIPDQLRNVLWEHCLKSTDEDKIARARNAFAPNATPN